MVLSTSITDQYAQSKQIVQITKPIKSYIYKKPAKKIVKPVITQLEQVNNPSQEKIEQEATNKDISIRESQTEKNQLTVINKPVSKTTPVIDNSQMLSTKDKASKPAIFNPLQSRAAFAGKLNDKMMADFNKEHSSKGFSAMQTLPNAVPNSVFKKSASQVRAEATTQIGNETFVKLDGVCTQTTDLSSIDDNLGSVTSFSDCGETDEEKYFREFMTKKIKDKGVK